MGRLNGGLFAVIYQNWDWEALSDGGLISFGAILGGMLYGYLTSRIFKFSTGKILDLIALILALAESIYRIGCMLMGCCFGRETTGFGGIYLPEIHGVWAYRYPTQIMLMVFNLALFVWLWVRSSRQVKPGSQAFIFLIVYSVGRFFVDFLRGDMPMVGIFGYHQIESIAILYFNTIGVSGTSKIKASMNIKIVLEFDLSVLDVRNRT